LGLTEEATRSRFPASLCTVLYTVQSAVWVREASPDSVVFRVPGAPKNVVPLFYPRPSAHPTQNKRPKHRKPVLLGRASGSYQNGNLSSLANRRRVESTEALLGLFRLKGHLLPFAEVFPSRRTRYIRDVKKYVFPPIFRRNETESFLGVEEFDRSVLHSSLYFGCPTLHRGEPTMGSLRRRCLGVTVTQFAYDVPIPRSPIPAVP